jgi:3-oxoadipate enol-lactonase
MLDLASKTRRNGIGWAAELAKTTNFAPDTEDRKVPAAAKEAYGAQVAGSDPEGYARTCEMIVDAGHVDPEYGNIKCPALFVAGEADNISPPQRSIDLSVLLGGESWVEVVRSGHQPILEDTKAVGTALGKLLAKVGV